MKDEISESVVGRIRKLQRLTRSNNEHEAALAAAKMQELLFAYNLSVDALRDPSEYVEEERRIGGRIWARRLMISLCKNNFCKPLLGGWAGIIFVIGRRDNVAAVNAMFLYLVGEINRIATMSYAAYRTTTPWPEDARSWSQGFRNGAVSAIDARLQTQRQDDIAKIEASVVGTETGTAIIRRLDLELVDEVARRHPVLGAARASRSYVRSIAGYQAGQAAGGRMALNRSAGHLA